MKKFATVDDTIIGDEFIADMFCATIKSLRESVEGGFRVTFIDADSMNRKQFNRYAKFIEAIGLHVEKLGHTLVVGV